MASTISVTNDITGKNHTYFYVPAKVANAVVALLDECEKKDSSVVSAELDEEVKK